MNLEISKAKELIEQSFLKAVIKDNTITDISYNGEQLYAFSSRMGRTVINQTILMEDVFLWVKQLANLMSQPFNYTHPLLDISVERYRLFAVGPSIARKGFAQTITFSLRIHPSSEAFSLLFLNDHHLKPVVEFCLSKRLSIVISGVTGVGKTQLQKECLMLLPSATRVIVIDSIMELDGFFLNHLDMTHWQVKEGFSFHELIVAALRSHPDWLLIAESRGHEFMDVFQSVLTGHPVITTLHAEDGYLAYKRMLRLVLMHEVQGKAEDVLISLQEAFPVIIHLKIKKTETIERYIETISVYRHHQLTTFHHQMDQVMVAKLLKDIQ